MEKYLCERCGELSNFKVIEWTYFKDVDDYGMGIVKCNSCSAEYNFSEVEDFIDIHDLEFEHGLEFEHYLDDYPDNY